MTPYLDYVCLFVISGAQTYKYDLPNGVLQGLEQFVDREHPSGTVTEYLDTFDAVMTIEGLQLPCNFDEAL